VKTLPDNPNADHLRQQAKDLLAGLRDSEPGATLSDAQASLAEQYGFRTWTELRAEVDRRRGQADVADHALACAVAERYGLGEVTGKMRSVVRADESGRQWSLETERGRWAVRTMDTWKPIVDAEADVALQEAAIGQHILLPAPVRSRSGAIVESIVGHTWRVHEGIHSGPPLAAPVSSAIAYRVGEILAKIHRLGLPVDRISPWHESRLSELPWPELAAKAKAKRAGWATALAEAVPALIDLDNIGEGAAATPPVLSHNTLGPGNVRRGTNGRLIVVGWEHAGGQPPSWELGDALVHWTIDPNGGINAAGARAMIEAYRSQADSLPPLDMTMFSGAATSITNYVSEELGQALTATADEDKRHADRTARHLLSHLPSRAAFEQLLDVAGRTR
jgi:Ser/Thr protein kinase RdoA (MazF antagonist)